MRPNICSICGFTCGGEEIVYGPVMSLCPNCVGVIVGHILASTSQMVSRPVGWDEDRKWYCSFCGKSSDEVRILVEIKTSSHDCICNECITLCIDEIVAKHSKLQMPIKLNISQANN